MSLPRTVIDRVYLYSIPEPNTGCTLWFGPSNPDGYGVLSFMRNGKQTSTPAHRAAWIIRNGDVPGGLHLDHLCRNRWCVNPDHLEPVTPKENQHRSPISPTGINAAKSHCHAGHDLSADVRLRGTRRECCECSRTADRLRKRRYRAEAKQRTA